MKAAIISVGTELLFGQITNTNTVFLSQQLNLLGFDVLYHYTVGDNEDRLKKTINKAFDDCELILTTGGLGPTEDDITKEVVSKVMGKELKLHQESLYALKNYYKTMNRNMPENNLKQALLPEDSTVFFNGEGTAPGFAIKEGRKIIMAFPGPPREMKSMFMNKAFPYLKEISGGTIYYKILRTFGRGESALETDLIDLINNQTDPTIATYAKEGECSIRVASKKSDPKEAEIAVAEMIKKIDKIAGQYIFSYDNEDLWSKVSEKLVKNNISISCAESCTGGMFAEKLTDYPGISKIFDRGLVTYSYGAKEDELGVKKETLEKYTAISPQVAEEMVEGVYEKTKSDICISITGVAGPERGGKNFPVGLMYIGLKYKEKIQVKEIRIRNINRRWNRSYGVLSMFDFINKTLEAQN